MRPELDNTQLFEVMRRSARDWHRPGKDNASGFGELDVGRALTWPAPIRDPQEPNDDMEFVRPPGFFATGTAPLTTMARAPRLARRAPGLGRGPARPLPRLAARRRAVRVTLRSGVDVERRRLESGARSPSSSRQVGHG